MSKPVAAYAQAQQSTVVMQAKQADVVPKLPVITIVPDANPTCTGERREFSSATARQRELNSTNSMWNASFCDCCCSVAPTYCCIVTCCPCTTIASVKENLGGGYEWTLLYFGGLAFGFLMSVGFAASNSSNEPADHPADNMTAPPPPESHDASAGSSFMWKAIAAMFLVTFLFGVWRLRAQTRHSLGIHGSHFNDCLSSFFCCFCVISQLHLELKFHYEEPPQNCRRGQGDDNLASTCPVDTLAPYAVM